MGCVSLVFIVEGKCVCTIIVLRLWTLGSLIVDCEMRVNVVCRVLLKCVGVHCMLVRGKSQLRHCSVTVTLLGSLFLPAGESVGAP